MNAPAAAGCEDARSVRLRLPAQHQARAGRDRAAQQPSSPDRHALLAAAGCEDARSVRLRLPAQHQARAGRELARARLPGPRRERDPARPARRRENALGDQPRDCGGRGRPARLLRHARGADRVPHRGQGRRQSDPAAARAHPSGSAGGRRDRLPAGQPGRRRALLPAHQRPAREGVDCADVEQGFRGLGRRAGRRGDGGGSHRPPCAPLPYRQHPRQQLPDEGSSEPAAVRLGSTQEVSRTGAACWATR